jgi:cytochrome c peroxidase
VARGEVLFNTRRFDIAGVRGFNDEIGIASVAGTCGTCHDAPGAGTHSVPAPFDIGLSDAALRSPDMPLYTLKNKATGELARTTDPGRALVTGKWKDIGRFKTTGLRGLASHSPYFHNGLVDTLGGVVAFYNGRFKMGLTDTEMADLAAFLRVL